MNIKRINMLLGLIKTEIQKAKDEVKEREVKIKKKETYIEEITKGNTITEFIEMISKFDSQRANELHQTEALYKAVGLSEGKKLKSNAISSLTGTEQEVLYRRLVLKETLNTIGLAAGVTGQRIRQIEFRALRKLRHPSRIKGCKEKEVKQVDLPLDQLLSESVNILDLSVRTACCLQNVNIKYIYELVSKTEGEMLRTKNFGRKSLNEIKEILSGINLRLSMGINKVKFDEKLRPSYKHKLIDFYYSGNSLEEVDKSGYYFIDDGKEKVGPYKDEKTAYKALMKYAKKLKE